MPNPELKLVIPVEAGTTGLRKGPNGEGDMFLDSDDSYELKYNQDGTARTVVNLTGTQTLTNKTLTSPTLTTPTLTNPAITGVAPVAFTSGTSLALTAATHANRVVYVTRSEERRVGKECRSRRSRYH